MGVIISPLDLQLDTKNPRFVVLPNNTQSEIRKYLVAYEDVDQLSSGINNYGSLLPGERIVALYEDECYVVVEGNRRTCSLQLLLSRDLIPDGFHHKIPVASENVLINCQSIEVDVLPDREAALELMSKRHIEGVKQWKPIAKKQFFATNYLSGQSVENLSKITGIRQGEIKDDIRDYKFFMSSYSKYCDDHPEFDKDIVRLKTDPFWRIFHAKFEYPIGTGSKITPAEILKFSYDEEYTTISELDSTLFEQIVQLVFEQTIVLEKITTRDVLTSIDGILPLLDKITKKVETTGTSTPGNQKTPDGDSGNSDTDSPNTNANTGANSETGVGKSSDPKEDSQSGNLVGSGGPAPGGPPPRSFFETIRWHGNLNPSNPDHEGLLVAIDELYRLSHTCVSRQKAYQVFPVASGMILRTVYEQALKLRLMKVNLWGTYCATLSGNTFPTLSGMEKFIKLGENKAKVLTTQDMVDTFDRVIATSQRDFLNANIHKPGKIRMTSASLESIASGGMFHLIQCIIDLLP